MFESLKRLYVTGQINDAKLIKAMMMGFITKEQKEMIINELYNQNADSTI